MEEELIDWKSKGGYISYGPFAHQLFVISLGNEQASAERTLLLIHGFPESSFSFHKVIDGLLQYFDRIVLLDMLGYGFSDKPIGNYTYSLLEQADTILDVWKQLNVRGGHILAHDMGTSVTTEILARHEHDQMPIWFSEGIQSITFTNGSMVLDLANLRITQKILLSKLGRSFNRLTNYTIFQHQIRSAHGNNSLTVLDVKLLWAINTIQAGHRKAFLTIQYVNDRKRFERTRWLPALAKTNIPIHICWGDKDAVASVEMAYYLKQEICKDASLSIMKGVGHFCQLGSPHIWLEKVLEFYQTT